MPSGSIWSSARPLIIGRALTAVLGVALPMVLARTLDQSAFGTYKQLYLVANLALYSLQFGLTQSLFYFVPRATCPKERATYTVQVQALLGATGVLAATGLVLFVPLLAERFSNPELATLAWPLALLAGSLIAAAPLEITLTARGKPRWSAIAQVSTEFVRVPAMLIPVVLGAGIRGLAWGAASAALVRVAVALAVTLAGARDAELSRGKLWKLLVYALPFGAAVLLAMPQQQMHQLFVAARVTPALFAIYSVGCMQIPLVGLLYGPVAETLQVRLAGLERTGELHRAGAAFAEAVDKLALVFLPVCALLVATATPGLRFLYGTSYLDSAAVLRIAVLGIAFASLPLDGVLKARARNGTLLAIYAGKLALTWPLLAVGFHLFGMEGAIAAHVSVEMTTKAVQLGVVSRELGVPWRELLGGRASLRSLAIGAVVLAGASGLVALIPHPLFACAASGLFATLMIGAEAMRRRRAEVGVSTPADSRESKVA